MSTEEILLLVIGLLTWIATLILAYGTGWSRGHAVAVAAQKWARWFMHQHGYRTGKF